MSSHYPLIDCHVHIHNWEGPEGLPVILDQTGVEHMNIVCLFDRNHVNDNPEVFKAKMAYPDKFYMFGALDHTSYFTSGVIETPTLSEQIDRLIESGVDGLKMLENKPTTRKVLDIPVDSDYFDGLFARLEETRFPVLWHVADPEEFWDPELTPGWAKEQGWGYDETFVPKEQLYVEVERVLERHPNLQIIFAHFFFLSADLNRAAALFDRFPGVHFDLAPGVELLYNLSRNVSETRDFFETYADRILYGTDIWASMGVEQARIRSGIVRRWLETDDEYRVPDEADFLLGPPEDGIIKGLSLSDEALAKIYSGNFQKLAGDRPKELRKHLVREESERIEKQRVILQAQQA